ncbi:MAG: glycoside hydrolase family 9 protein [Oscillospiraceae bacterium]|nr:glycoside hydrolase family 9 protein [Oscillospiraceae bacterium]
MKNRFYINRVGYMVGMDKTVACTVYGRIFSVVDVRTGAYVYEGRLSQPFTDKESGDTVRIADLSDFNVQGRYFIKVGLRRSESFDIAPFPYRILREKVMDAVYLSRCGCETDHPDLPQFAHGPCHTEAVTYEGRTFDVGGGWHTGGDYSKSVPGTCIVIADMLYSLMIFPYAFDKTLRKRMEVECFHGLEFITKMQAEDGGVYDSVRTDAAVNVTAPADDANKYHLTDKSAVATLRFAAVCALASRYYAADLPLSRKLASAAQTAWLYMLESEEYQYYKSKFGDISDEPDGVYTLSSEFMWAACELYSLTGGSRFAELIDKKYTGCLFSGFGDRFTGGYAALAYMLTDKPKKDYILSFIRMRWTYRGDRLWVARCSSGYHSCASAGGDYHYGSNIRILGNIRMAELAFMITGDRRYLTVSTDSLSYLMGVNPMGTAFMTDNRNGFCRNPAHAASMAAEGDICLPGLMVCGADQERSDPYVRWNIENGTPPSKCYADSPFSLSTNEPGLNISSPLFFISAFYDSMEHNAFNVLS